MKEEEKQIQKGTRRWQNVTGLSSVEFCCAHFPVFLTGI
jgi:hypothetical protein